jgi:hypothetical protein
MKSIKVYKVVDRDDSDQKPMYYKGIEELRDFAIDRLYSGWDTKVEEEDLNDDDTLFDFLQNDYGVDIEVITEVFINPLKQ